ncbi:hypothetical protein IscW_ISCW011830 [Ixodes scapularis]|uniref:Uncharacterized protein n=1 Tax=Ixodes scapularis TaxID=6945 RepID=B7Q8H4_IXOSC|nr:hypothetical protein IscW_ISCW011830 [Ixodes scapularis]|eukprot:XP_002412362.1 hypothetical protein IscW_ISCW011830 [Ixodes scapularis]
MSLSASQPGGPPECYGGPPTSSGGGGGGAMQNGAYSWVGAPPALSQKSWPPGYQASLTNLFLKKNPLHFGTGISQLAAASSYLEKMSTLGSAAAAAAEHGHHKCPHPDAKDKPYPCDLCHKYLTLCNSLRVMLMCFSLYQGLVFEVTHRRDDSISNGNFACV